jgi:hypothetical protein
LPFDVEQFRVKPKSRRLAKTRYEESTRIDTRL